MKKNEKFFKDYTEVFIRGKRVKFDQFDIVFCNDFDYQLKKEDHKEYEAIKRIIMGKK